jgi:hypothetical protein
MAGREDGDRKKRRFRHCYQDSLGRRGNSIDPNIEVKIGLRRLHPCAGDSILQLLGKKPMDAMEFRPSRPWWAVTRTGAHCANASCFERIVMKHEFGRLRCGREWQGPLSDRSSEELPLPVSLPPAGIVAGSSRRSKPRSDGSSWEAPNATHLAHDQVGVEDGSRDNTQSAGSTVP